MENIENQVKALSIERRQIKAAQTRFRKFLEKYSDDKISELQARAQTIGETLHLFNKIQTQIELLRPDELESDERETFENKYFSNLGMANDLLEQDRSNFEIGLCNCS